MRGTIFKLALAVIALGAILSATGCASGRIQQTTSVVDYLYPGEKDQAANPGTPVLSLPLRVGIAFVPDAQPTRGNRGGVPLSRIDGSFVLTERQKMDLMQEVAGYFKQYPFVHTINLIPSAYLEPRGSFANLDRLRTMYNVDVVALLSYDQAQFTDEGALSLTYLTIVGAYLVPAEKNDTHTMLDAVVYDIRSRKMLFRAPGTSQIKGHATLMNLSEQRRKDSDSGFQQAAAAQMIENLDQQLALFRQRAKERPDEYKVIRPPNYKRDAKG